MDLKTFRKPTVREALREAREALGPDALVVATDMVPASGLRGLMGRREVQITAAVEPTVSASRPSTKERRPSVIDAESEALVARLVASGLDRPMAEGIVRAIPYAQRRGASASRLFRAVADSVAPMTAVDTEFAAAEVFVGPPGVGKTTTIAKIAARERARHGRAIPMIAGDGFRAGAVEQLRTYADIIGSAFRVARTSDELEYALTRTRRTVLVDTAGRSPKDDSVREHLAVLARHEGVRTHLVIAADTSVSSAKRIFDAYADVNPARVVITKVDEAESLAALASVLRERGIPISYITTGQRVPDDLERATPDVLAGAILGELPERSEATQ
jgi:flagellar biosynthesis protein FlhF